MTAVLPRFIQQLTHQLESSTATVPVRLVNMLIGIVDAVHVLILQMQLETLGSMEAPCQLFLFAIIPVLHLRFCTGTELAQEVVLLH